MVSIQDSKNLLVKWLNKNQATNVQTNLNKNSATNVQTTPNPQTDLKGWTQSKLQQNGVIQPTFQPSQNLNISNKLQNNNIGAGNLVETPSQSRFIGFQNVAPVQEKPLLDKVKDGRFFLIPSETSTVNYDNRQEEERYNQQAKALEDLQQDIYKLKRTLTESEINTYYSELADNMETVMQLQRELKPILASGNMVSSEQLEQKYNQLLQPKNLKDIKQTKKKTEEDNKLYQESKNKVDTVLKGNWKGLSADGLQKVKDMDTLYQATEAAKKRGVVGGATDFEILSYLVKNTPELKEVWDEMESLNFTEQDKSILGGKNVNRLLKGSTAIGNLVRDFAGANSEFKPSEEEVDTVIRGKKALDEEFQKSTLKKISTELGVSADSLEKFIYRTYKDWQNYGLENATAAFDIMFPKSYWEDKLGTKLSDSDYMSILGLFDAMTSGARSEKIQQNRQNVMDYTESVNKEYENRKAANLNPDIENYVNGQSMTSMLLQGDLKPFLYKSSGEAAQNVDNLIIMGMGVAAPEAVLPIMFADSYARESQESFEELMEVQKKMGISQEEAYDNARKGSAYVGLASSLVEVGLEKVLGGVETTASTAFHDILMKDFTERATKMVAEKGLVDLLKQGAVTQFKASLEEGLEEVFQQAIHNKALQEYDPDQKITEGMLESFEGGFYNWMNLLAGGGDVLSNMDTESMKQSALQGAYNAGVNTRNVYDTVKDTLKNTKNKVTSLGNKTTTQNVIENADNKVTTNQTDNQNTSITPVNNAINPVNNNIAETNNDIIELKDVTDLDERAENEETENQTTELAEGLGDKVWDSLSGIEENTRDRMKKNPYSAQENKRLIDTIESDPGIDINDYMLDRYDEVLNSIEDSLNKEENRRKDVGKLYQTLEETNAPIDATNLKNKIPQFQQKMEDLGDILSSSDQSKVKTILENIQQIGDGTMDVWKARKIADQWSKRGEASTDGLRLIREIRDSIDEEIRNQRPEMKEVDQEYRKSLDDIRDLKGNLVNKRTGEFKGNAVNIVKNMLSGTNRAYLTKLEKYIPGIKQRLQAIRDVKFVYNAYETGNGSRFQSGIGKAVFGNIFKFLGATGGIPGVIAGAAVDAGVEAGMKSLTRKALRETVLKETERSRAELEKINQKIEEGKQLEAQDKQKLKEIGEKIVKNAEEAQKTKAEQEAWDKYFENIKNQQALPESIKLTKVTEINKPTTPKKPKNKVTKKSNKKSDSNSDIDTTPTDTTPPSNPPTTPPSGGDNTAKNKVTKKTPKKKVEKKVEVKETPKTETKQEENQTKKFTYDEYEEVMNKIGEVEKEINERLDKQMEQERAEKMKRFKELDNNENTDRSDGSEIAKLAGELNNLTNKYDRLKEEELKKQVPELLKKKEELRDAFGRDWKAVLDDRFAEIEKPFNELRDRYRLKLKEDLGLGDDVVYDEKFYDSLTPEQKKIADRLNKEYVDEYEKLRMQLAEGEQSENLVTEKSKVTERKQETKTNAKNKVTNPSKAKTTSLFNENEVEKGNESEGLNPDALPLQDYKEMQRLENGRYNSLGNALRHENLGTYMATKIATDLVGDYNEIIEDERDPDNLEDRWVSIQSDIEEMYEMYEDYLEKKAESPEEAKLALESADDLANKVIKGKTAKELIDQYNPDYQTDLKIYKRLLEKYPNFYNGKINLNGEYGKALREFAGLDNETAQDIDYQELAEEENETAQTTEEEMNKVTKKQVSKPKNLVTAKIEAENEVKEETTNPEIQIKEKGLNAEENDRYSEIRAYFQDLIDDDNARIERIKDNTAADANMKESQIKNVENRISKYQEALAMGTDLLEMDRLGAELAAKIEENLKGQKRGGTRYFPVKESKVIENKDGSKVKYLTTTKGDTSVQGGLIEVTSPEGVKESFVVQKIGNGPREVRVSGNYMTVDAIQNLIDITNGEYKAPKKSEKSYKIEQTTSASPQEQFMDRFENVYDRDDIKKELSKVEEWEDIVTGKKYKGTKAQRMQFYVDNPLYKIDQESSYGARKYVGVSGDRGESKHYLYGIEYDYAKFLEDNPDIRNKPIEPLTLKQRIEDMAREDGIEMPGEGEEVKYEKLPANVSVREESKKTGLKRIAPDRVIWQQETFDDGYNNVLKAVNDLSHSIIEEQKYNEYFKKAREEGRRNISEFRTSDGKTIQDMWKLNYNAITDLGFKSRNSQEYNSLIKNIKEANGNEAALKSIAKNLYIKRVSDDIGKHYIYPEAVYEGKPDLLKAKTKFEAYLKGYNTSFSSTDSRIDYSMKDTLGAGVKRQDGNQITKAQKDWILANSLYYGRMFNLDIKKLFSDLGITVVHLNGKNPFLTKGALGVYNPKTKSISVGNGEEKYSVGKGKDKQTKSVATTFGHELTHAIDFMLDKELFSDSQTRPLLHTFNSVVSDRGADYWDSKVEVTARMVEQYLGVEGMGRRDYFRKGGYWNEELYNTYIKPAVESAFKNKLGEYYKEGGSAIPEGFDIDSLIDEAGYDTPNSVTATDLNKVTNKTYPDRVSKPSIVMRLDENGNPLRNSKNKVTTKISQKWFGREENAIQNKEEVMKMKSVSDLKGNEFPQNGKNDLIDRIEKFYNDNYGGKVFREGLGDVLLDRDSIGDSLGHKIWRTKAIAFVSVPEVIKNGKLVQTINNYNGSDTNRYTIVAPITINGQRYLCRTIIKETQGTNRFYLHDVILEDYLK